MGDTIKFKLLISVIAASTWIVVTLMVYLNPSGTLTMVRPGPAGWLLLTIMPFLLALSGWITMTRKRGSSFFLNLAGFFLLSTAAIVWAAVLYHRDYFSLFFQYLVLVMIMALLRVPYLGLVRNKIVVYRALETAAWVVFLVFSFWICLMGYTIVVRLEPRWIESIIYNTLLGSILFVLLLAKSFLHEKSYKIISIHDGQVWQDERNLSQYLSDQQNKLLLAFLDAEMMNCTCTLLRSKGTNDDQQNECRKCVTQNFSAVSCKYYRNINNQISILRRSLEMLDIGTIVNVAENYRNNKTDGWRLRLFDDVIYKKK